MRPATRFVFAPITLLVLAAAVARAQDFPDGYFSDERVFGFTLSPGNPAEAKNAANDCVPSDISTRSR